MNLWISNQFRPAKQPIQAVLAATGTAATVDAFKIKVDDPSQTSTRYRKYVPFWA